MVVSSFIHVFRASQPKSTGTMGKCELDAWIRICVYVDVKRRGCVYLPVCCADVGETGDGVSSPSVTA